MVVESRVRVMMSFTPDKKKIFDALKLKYGLPTVTSLLERCISVGLPIVVREFEDGLRVQEIALNVRAIESKLGKQLDQLPDLSLDDKKTLQKTVLKQGNPAQSRGKKKRRR
jgi:hypothetical protein